MRDVASPARSDEECWWDAVLADPRAATPRPSPSRTLGGRSDLLRVECQRCMRIVEIRRETLYGSDAVWKDVDGASSTTAASTAPGVMRRTGVGLISGRDHPKKMGRSDDMGITRSPLPGSHASET
jgi:hypothetical protein